ncbi:MAG TPA: RNA 2',3'-cyclic phosphodiesterase [Polyangia bacterium]|nr:RNA 2',3'-cyclic phosphodiesterase [Polyangia bacterium]
MTETAIRSFVAVALPRAVQDEVAAAAGRLAGALSGVKWNRKAENLHVTMKFLGQVAPERLAALGAALREGLAEVAPFELWLQGFGAFPSARDAKVLFAGIADEKHELAEVAALVDAIAARFGFERETRAFTGHVTIGRSKEGVDARAVLSPQSGAPLGFALIQEVHVYESQLGSEGSTYVLRHCARLGAHAN